MVCIKLVNYWDKNDRPSSEPIDLLLFFEHSKTKIHLNKENQSFSRVLNQKL